MFLCFYVSMFLCFYVSMFLCFYVSMFLCFYVSMFLCFYVSMFLCFYVSMFLCFYVSMFVCPILYLVFTHDLPPTSKVFLSIFVDDLKYFVAVPNLSIITTKLLQQSMDDLSMENRAECWQDFKTLVPALVPTYP